MFFNQDLSNIETEDLASKIKEIQTKMAVVARSNNASLYNQMVAMLNRYLTEWTCRLQKIVPNNSGL